MNDDSIEPIEPRKLQEALRKWLADIPGEAGFLGRETQGGSRVLDLPALLERVGGDEELMREILEMFLEEAPRRIQEIKDNHERGDVLEMARHAHSLKGSAGTSGAVGLEELAGRLELVSASGDSGAIVTLIAGIERESDRFRNHILSRAAATE